MKIAIDIRRMTEFGVGTYIRNVIRTLGRLDHETTYFLLGASTKVKEIGPLPSNFHTVALAEPERSLTSYREFRTVVKRLECDLVHIPNLFSVPRALSCPYVMTVHDILDHLSRARERTGFWRTVHFQMTKQVLSGAARIFAVSNFTKLETEKLFNIPAGRIEVVYNAIDERLLQGHANPADRQLIVERYQVTYPFLLYAGRISPHKNVVRMIEAFSALKTELEKEELFPDLKLIIIGDDLSGNPDLRRTVIRSGVQNDVRFLG
ncbi:MAG: glycosyltransferase, partial [Candidatus Sulfotelmatobacter sp.]